MRKSLTIGGALLALAAFASTADARMGGGGMGMSSSMSHGGGHGSMSSSMGSPRGFSPDGRTFSPSGLATRVNGPHWKHPIDSDNGGPDDPPKKTPKGSTQAGNSDGAPKHPGYDGGGHQGKGYWDPYGRHHGPYPSGGSSASNSEPAPASRTPR